MSEYIYASNGEPLANECGEISLARVGEVVRCRDCKFCNYDAFAYWCCRERYREFKVDSLDGERMGFCAWGIKK